MLKRLPLMITLCFVMLCTASCGHDPGVDKAGITEYYAALESAEAQVRISADFPERVSDYRVLFNYSKDSADRIEIISPESVAGIRMEITGGKGEIVFEDVRLETGVVDKNGLTPLGALPKLFEIWAAAEPQQAQSLSRDGTDVLLMVYSEEGDTTEYRTWFDASSYFPVYAEVISEGRCVLRCEFESFSY